MSLFEPIFQALNQRDVRYVVVGGVAVVLHGHLRTTADLDLVVDLAPEQARKAILALTETGFRPSAPVDAADFADPDARSRWIREKGMQVFGMHDPDDPWRQVDLFVEDVDFDGLWARSKVVSIGGTEVHVASVEDLITLKQIAGRAQDLADIEALRLIADRDEGEDG